MRIAFTHNLQREKTHEQAEFDSASTIAAICRTLEELGHQVSPVEVSRPLPEVIHALERIAPDLVFNIAEGFKGRTREAVYPMLFEQLGLEYTGSDAIAMALTLDKAVAKRLVGQAGIATPRFVVIDKPAQLDRLDELDGLTFPLFVKPVAEGTSKGIGPASVCTDVAQVRRCAAAILARYPDGALVEEFLCGREFTVGLLDDGGQIRALPPMEVRFHGDDDFGVYSYAHKTDADGSVSFEVPAKVEPALREWLEQMAKAAFDALGCRDFARVDLRLDHSGKPSFIECNPLPGLSPGWSDLCVIAQAAGLSYRDLIQKILDPALRRFDDLHGQPPQPITDQTPWKTEARNAAD